MTLEIIEQIILYKGHPIKIENNKVYGRSFGTTIFKQFMHFSWIEIPRDKMKTEFKEFLKENKLI